MWHPVSLLLSWLAFALILQWLPPPLLMGLAALCLVLALTLAAERSRNLLMRSRWLLLSLAVLFLLLTPGEFLPGIGGDLRLTYEGLWHAGEQLSRLLAMLASLALLHQQVGTSGLLTGLYCLLRPFAWRERTVVRLMLVLEFVEQKQRIDWREWFTLKDSHVTSPESFSLPMPPFHWQDKLLIGSLLAMISALVFWL
ncbi:MAG: CbiQ family ECF transporter T component [Rhodocyclaceae bacterium]|nr:CbiQ family ECF transporter T component [Rhodocyclaceae bacterium]